VARDQILPLPQAELKNAQLRMPWKPDHAEAAGNFLAQNCMGTNSGSDQACFPLRLHTALWEAVQAFKPESNARALGVIAGVVRDYLVLPHSWPRTVAAQRTPELEVLIVSVGRFLVSGLEAIVDATAIKVCSAEILRDEVPGMLEDRDPGMFLEAVFANWSAVRARARQAALYAFALSNALHERSKDLHNVSRKNAILQSILACSEAVRCLELAVWGFGDVRGLCTCSDRSAALGMCGTWLANLLATREGRLETQPHCVMVAEEQLHACRAWRVLLETSTRRGYRDSPLETF